MRFMELRFLLKLSLLIVLSLVVVSRSFAQEIKKVDLFLLFDDTGSFSTFAPAVTNIFSSLVDGIETGLPEVEFGFGVGRFKDYGGPGWNFCSNHSVHCVDDFDRRVNGRPFYLNQPIITSASAGGRAQRDSLIIEALSRGAVGTGGDDPEGHIEALWQIVSGLGFDGNADGLRNGLNGSEVAGASATQLTPDQSGDIPSFNSLSTDVLSSGDFGGVGYRADALKLIIIATEICPAIAFPAGTTIPSVIQGKYSSELVADFACLSATPGDDRFGFIANSVSSSTNTVANAVVPLGSAALPATILALNGADIRVIGMGPGLLPKPSGSGADHDPSGFLSALARITGGVDNQGTPLVFDIGVGGAGLRDRIVQSIFAATTVNPGCTDQDLSAVFAAIDANIIKQRNLAVSLARKTQAKRTAKKTTARVAKLVSQNYSVTQAFPKLVKVCQSSACVATDRSADIKTLRDTSNALKSIINGRIKIIANNNKKAAKKSRKSAKVMLSQLNDNIAAIPTQTNQCL